MRHPERLDGLHPKLVAVVKRAAEQAEFMVVEGVRSDEQCFVNYGKGRNAAQCLSGGCPAQYAQPKLGKVTWLAKALGSNHRKKPDGYGHAVDLLPAPFDWKRGFDELAKVMLAAAKAEGVKLRWGADWDRDGHPHEPGETDAPHFEIEL
jgi:peptidoglycan L-alanyl-D-glutamate endopeptidase CwlK